MSSADDGAAIDDDERGFRRARRLTVHGLGDLLFGRRRSRLRGAASVALGDGFELLEELAHDGGAAEHGGRTARGSTPESRLHRRGDDAKHAGTEVS